MPQVGPTWLEDDREWPYVVGPQKHDNDYGDDDHGDGDLDDDDVDDDDDEYEDAYYTAAGGGYLSFSGNCCVLEGTLISTSPSSSVAVETLAVSDEVLSKDISLFDDDMTVEELRVWSGSNIDGSQAQALVTANN